MGQQQRRPLSGPAQDQVNLINNAQQQLTIESVIVQNRVPNLADHLLVAWQVRSLLEHSRPASEQYEARRVYDTAVRVLGGGNSDRARQALDQHMASAIQQLNSALESGADLGTGTRRERLATMLTTIRDNMDDPDHLRDYMAYRAIALHVSGLRAKVLMEQAPAPQPATAEGEEAESTTSSAGSTEVRSLRSPIFDQGRIHYISTTGNVRAFAVGREVAPEQISSFSSQQAAQQFVGALSHALAAWYNNEAQDVGCPALLSAMDGVTNQQMLQNPHFQAARDLLRQGQRDRALEELRQIGPLYNSLEDAANNLTVATISNRFVTVFTAKATIVFDLAGDMSDFETYLASRDERPAGRAVVQFFTTMAFDMLEGHGTVTEGVRAGTPGSGVTRTVPASGWAISATPGLAISTSAGSTPMRIIAHCNFGYRDVQLDEPIRIQSQTGEMTEEPLRQHGAYVGVWGLEVQFPERTGYSSPVRVERAGVGAVGDPRNALAYVTFSGTYHREGNMRLQALVTPMYSGFWDEINQTYQARPGIEIEPISWMQNFGRHLVTAGLRERIEVNATTGVITFDTGAHITYSPNPQWEISGNFGFLIEPSSTTFRPEGEAARLPGMWGTGGYPYLGLGVRWTPFADSERPERHETVPPDAVPVRIDRSQETSLQRRFREAQTMVRTNPEQAEGEEGQRLARDLAGSIDGQMIMAVRTDIRNNEHYRSAMTHLRAGRLQQGLEELAQVPGLFQ